MTQSCIQLAILACSYIYIYIATQHQTYNQVLQLYHTISQLDSYVGTYHIIYVWQLQLTYQICPKNPLCNSYFLNNRLCFLMLCFAMQLKAVKKNNLQLATSYQLCTCIHRREKVSLMEGAKNLQIYRLHSKI